ncbi:MAG TPA: oligosaccharide flippase family protein [Verrucomicrobiae bacterium]|nr:oligosaccharide flippase family protein [Verrucomicrobiae bacterium]
MSRIKRLAHSLASGYVLLGANVIYTLTSFRLAGKYLGPAEFGLWAVVTNLAQYIALIDLGMTSTSRILIDYKDHRDAGDYGSVIKTFLVVSLIQAILIVLLSIGLAVALVPVLHIPGTLKHQFIYLTIGQCGVLGAGFLSRIFPFVLSAHQRYDLVNYTQTAGFALGLGAMWAAFVHHQGIYSTLWAQFASWLVNGALTCVWVLRMQLLPARRCWGRATWSRFRELFALGSDLFLYALGFQMLSASQTVILTRQLGLEASALWSVCTRTFSLVSQIIYRVFDYAGPALAEMIVRGERERLYQRFRSLVVLSASLSVCAGTIFAICNQPFVALWMRRQYGWWPLNDGLLAFWLVLQATTRCHLGLVGVSKEIRSMRFIYLAEGTFFVVLGLLVLRWGGITAMLLCSIAGTMLFSAPYGFWRTSQYFNVPWKVPSFEWWLPPLRLALGLVPLAGLLWWLTRPLPLRPQLLIRGAASALLALPLLLRFGLDAELRKEILARAPARFQPLLRTIASTRMKDEG